MTRRVTVTEAEMKRATRLTLIAEAGGGAQEVMAWGGHVTMSEADGYVRRANRRALLIGKDDVGKMRDGA